MGFDLIKTGSRALLHVRKQSPHILMGAGVLLGIATVVLACKQTLKAPSVLEQHEAKMEAIDNAVIKADTEGAGVIDYTLEDEKKDRFIVYCQTAKDFAKLYWLPVVLGILSVGALIGSHGIMTKRNVALVAAYKGLEEAFKKYRGRVIGEFGVEKDDEFKAGAVAGDKTDTGLDSLVRRMTDIEEGPGLYLATFSRESSKEWEDVPMFNVTKLHLTEQHMNDKLRMQGHLFLNEVYDALGMERTPEGSVVGWVLDRTPGEANGYVDFNIKEYFDEAQDGTLRGTDEFYLEFNVDGVIFDRI